MDCNNLDPFVSLTDTADVETLRHMVNKALNNCIEQRKNYVRVLVDAINAEINYRVKKKWVGRLFRWCRNIPFVPQVYVAVDETGMYWKRVSKLHTRITLKCMDDIVVCDSVEVDNRIHTEHVRNLRALSQRLVFLAREFEEPTVHLTTDEIDLIRKYS